MYLYCTFSSMSVLFIANLPYASSVPILISQLNIIYGTAHIHTNTLCLTDYLCVQLIYVYMYEEENGWRWRVEMSSFAGREINA